VWLGDIPVATIRISTNGSTVGVFYIHTDNLNTPRKITDPTTNTVIWRWDSDAYGYGAANQDPDGDGLIVQFNVRGPGEYADVESNLIYNWNRYRDPQTAFVESDPVGLGGGSLSTYAPLGENPISNIDPTGLELLCGSNYCGSDIPAYAPTPAADVTPEVKAYLCKLINDCKGNKYCIYRRTLADRRGKSSDGSSNWLNPLYRQAENFAYAEAWDTWQNWYVFIYGWQLHKFLPFMQTSPFSQDALNAGLAGKSHQDDSPQDLAQWCNDCGK